LFSFSFIIALFFLATDSTCDNAKREKQYWLVEWQGEMLQK